MPKSSIIFEGLITALVILAVPSVSAIDLQFTPIAELNTVVDIRHAGDGSARLFLVANNLGQIHILKGGTLLSEPFIDIRDRITIGAGGERGLLSLAFAPDYSTSGLFYVWYTDTSGDTTLSRFSVSDNPDLADSNSEEILLVIPQPFVNHNGGRLIFGFDKMLYLSTGDGGNTDGDLRGNGQSLNTLLGKIIRIDVNPAVNPYGIPPDNPFVGNNEARDEIWAYGMRNPWRMSIDRLTGDLYIADVGQEELEEINHQSVSSDGGENYGWNIMEGSQCFSVANCDQTRFISPVAEYSHDEGCAVIGGEVYRGTAYPNLIGIYLYGDWCSGRLWGLSRDGSSWQTNVLADTGFKYESSNSIITFGEGEDGSIYLSDGSRIYLISDGPVIPEANFTINAGLNDAWVNLATAGQGFLITVFPDIKQMFLAWFTYDTERPPEDVTAQLGEPGHRWLTAQGPYDGDTANLTIFVTEGGIFDAAEPVAETDPAGDGTMTIEFADCTQGLVNYEITSLEISGEIPIQRITPDNVALCEAL